MSWQATQLRYSVFPSGSATVDPDKWWQAVLQVEPDHVQIQPKANVAEFRGEYADGQIVLGVIPTRVDWIYLAKEDEFGLPQTLGTFEEALGIFSSTIDRWLKLPDCPNAHRIALGAIMRIDVDSIEAGYKALDLYLPALHLDENTSDIIYQINRPRTSEIVGKALRINRLSKWNVVRVQAGRQTLANNYPLLAETSQTYVQVELDINTTPSEDLTLAPPSAAAAFAVLSVLALEIAERGDVP